MPTIVTTAELRAVLGVSVALYSDAILNDCIDASEIVVLPMLKALPVGGTWVGNSAVEQAVLSVAVEVFSSRNSAGGQAQGVDGVPAPFRLGRSLFNRVSGLLGNLLDVETMAQ